MARLFESNRRRIAATIFFCLLLAAIIVGINLAHPHPSLIVLPSTSPYPTTSAERLIPHGWKWAWRLHGFLTARQGTLRINIRNFGFTNSLESLAAHFNLGDPLATTNGLRIWIVPAQTLPGLGEYASSFAGVRFIDNPSLGVAYGQAGEEWTVTYVQQLKWNLMDINTTLHQYRMQPPQNETFTTIHAQLTKGSGVFIAPSNQYGIFVKDRLWMMNAGVIISGIAIDSKGNEVIY